MRAKCVTGLTLALLLALPVGVAAQSQSENLDDVVNQNNTPFGATSAEFLLLGAGARGTALGGALVTNGRSVSPWSNPSMRPSSILTDATSPASTFSRKAV